jgi:hypothetical protein
MAITRFQRKNRRFGNSHLAIAVFPSASTAFMAYRLLHYHGVSPENLAIVGEGYSKPEWVGLTESKAVARQRQRTHGFLGCLFGSALGFGLTGTYGALALLGGLPLVLLVPLGAALGSALATLVSWLASHFSSLGRLSIYRHHLQKGNYLLMIEGAEKIVKLSQEVLGQYATPKV